MSASDTTARRRWWWGATGLLGLLGLLAVAAWGWSRRPSPPPAPVPLPLTLGLALQPTGTLALVAADRGHFAAAGLTVQVTACPSGQRAMEALLKGEVAIATTAEVPIVINSFARPDLRVFASLAVMANDAQLVARRDRGVATPGELRGKRIGTQRASAVHYFLHLFLLRHGLLTSDVELVFLPAEQLPAALAAGQVDAISMREPYVSQAIAALGDQAVVFTEPELYWRTEHIVTTTALATAQPELLRRVVRALLRAEADVARAPAAAAAVVADRLGVPAAVLRPTWRGAQWRVTLDQSLLNTFEDEAAWARRASLVTGEGPANFLVLLEPGPLLQEHPEAVTLIR